MNLGIKYIDKNIAFSSDYINVVEIENKDYFYRLVSDLNNVSIGNVIEDIYFYDKNYHELNLLNKINMCFDYFNFDFNTKKIQTLINKKINEKIETIQITELSKLYEKIKKIYLPFISELDLNLSINNEFDTELMTKLLNVVVDKKEDLLENLLLLIDIEKVLKVNELIVFINLKQYLNSTELIELYKYSLYNGVSILLIDSQSYGISNKYEKKLLIDNELEEYNID